MKNRRLALKITICALLSVMSLTLFIIESMIPPIVPIPGMKIGLAYIPVLFSVYLNGNWKKIDSGLILITRIILSSIISSGLMSLCFSFFGGLLSFITMSLISKTIKDKWGIIFCGIFSAVMHNIGQLIAATLFYSPSVWAYLPYLVVSSVITGFFTGMVVYLLIHKKTKIISEIEKI